MVSSLMDFKTSGLGSDKTRERVLIYKQEGGQGLTAIGSCCVGCTQAGTPREKERGARTNLVSSQFTKV